MKKIGAMVLVLFIFAGISFSASAVSLGAGSARVFDYAALMSANDITTLEAQIADLRAQYAMDIVVLTSTEAQTDASQAYADDFYDYNGFGNSPDGNGFLFFIDMNNRVPTISTKGLMIRYVTDDRLAKLLDVGYDDLTQGNYGTAAVRTLTLLKSYLQQGIPAGQYNIDESGNRSYYTPAKALTLGEAAISLGTGLLVALIFIIVVRYRYGLKGSTYKYDLHANTTVHITGAVDEYLRTTVTRVRRQTSSSGGGGPGSSTHRSSSGSTHGGGSGRRF